MKEEFAAVEQYFQTMYQANLAAYNALEQAGITIPFPQRDVHMLSKNQS